MNKKVGIILGIVIVIFGLLVVLSIAQNNASTSKYNDYNIYSVIEGDDNNGGIGDHVKGNKNAKVLLFEYADYQCSGCASNVKSVKKLLEKYGDKIGIVYRTNVLSYHANGKAAAAAAEAAGLQGYWEQYGDLLYANQNDWAQSDASTRTTQFENYFEKVSGGKGDMEKFRSDISSEAVAKKIEFDTQISKRVGEIQYTPAFYMDGKFLDWAGNDTTGSSDVIKNTDPKGKDFVTFMSEIIDQKLAEQK